MVDEPGKRSVWVRQLASGSAVQVANAFPNSLGGTTFSRDGKFLYYNDGPRVMMVPIAGGPSREVARGDTGAVCVSPDGKSLAFMRREQPRTTLVVANADGTGARVIAGRNAPESRFFFSCSWSPDSKMIAIGGSRATAKGEYPNAVLAVDARSGATKQIGEESWGVMGRLNWLRDNSGIVFEASRRGEPAQLYEMPLPRGTAMRLTGDMTADYIAMSITVADDGKTAVGVRHVYESKIWIVPVDGSSAPRQLSMDAASQGIHGVSSTPAGQVLFSSNASGTEAIWMAGADRGAAPRQITPDQVPASNPQVTPDGRYLVFAGSIGRGDAPVRQRLDGGDFKRLGLGNTVALPVVAPDSQWVFYGRQDPLPEPGWALWKSNLVSGEEKLVTKGQIWPLGFTPDGKVMLAWVFLPQGEQFVLLSTETWEITKSVPLPRAALRAAENFAPPRLTPDGASVSYVDVRGGVGNIWAQPINGSDARQLTHFEDQQIFSFAWLRQGEIIVARGTQRSDAVLIRDLR